MGITNYPNGLSSFGVPVAGPLLLSGNVLWVKKVTDADYESFVETHTYVSEDGTPSIFNTIQSAVDATANNANDIILVTTGEYDETVTIENSHNGITIIGLGGSGATFIEPSESGAKGMVIDGASDVTIMNLGVAGDTDADAALHLIAANRFNASGCKIEGADTAGAAILMSGIDTDQTGDSNFNNCEIAWAYDGVRTEFSDYGYVTQVHMRNCLFHNCTNAAFAETEDGGGSFRNLSVTDCVFDGGETGNPPTKYLDIGGTGNSGIFAANRFAAADTESDSLFVIDSGTKWVANAGENGWSTAVPS